MMGNFDRSDSSFVVLACFLSLVYGPLAGQYTGSSLYKPLVSNMSARYIPSEGYRPITDISVFVTQPGFGVIRGVRTFEILNGNVSGHIRRPT